MCSQASFGTASDKLVVKAVIETRALINGSMKDIQFTLYINDGYLIVVKGAYLVSDAGFLQIGTFMDCRIQSWVSEDIRWAEYLELIRKDVVFGILKNRFRLGGATTRVNTTSPLKMLSKHIVYCTT